jgi:hypothetical protein
MADYETTPETILEGIKGLAAETLAAIKVAITGGGSNAPVKVIDTITANTIINPADNVIFTATGNVDKAALNKLAADIDVIDFSNATEGADLDFSATNPAGAAAPAAGNVIIGSTFGDKVTSNNSNQVLEGLDGSDSIKTGSGQDSLSGGNGDDSLASGAGDDSISTGTGQDSVDGGAGFDILNVDTVATSSSFDATTLILTDASGNKATVNNVQVVTFGDDYQDTQFVLDNAKQGAVTRLYEGVFDRKADTGGLKYWTNTVDSSDDPNVLREISNAFINSEEGKASKLDTMSNSDFVVKMYTEFLNRTGDTGGIDFWTKALDSGDGAKADIMVEFSQAEETVIITQDFIHIIGTSEIG